jgi:hypothetical protein
VKRSGGRGGEVQIGRVARTMKKAVADHPRPAGSLMGRKPGRASK